MADPRPLVLALLVAVMTVAGCSDGAEPAGAPPARPAPTTSVGTTPVPPTSTPTRTPVTPRPTPSRCPGTHADQLVIVSLAEQHAWLCHRGRTVRSFPVTSGRTTPGTRTPTGHFRIQGRNRNSVLTLASGRQYDVKYWIPFDAPDFGFHDAPWQHIPFGSARYRQHGSHGCIHLPTHAVAFLYRWVRIGAHVHIEQT